MQKKLLGVAVAAALAVPTLALAQSSVQVYGTVHMSLNRASFSGDTAGTLNSDSKWGVTNHASNWGLRSTENLGGGLTAWFQTEFNMQLTRNNGVSEGENTSRNSGVGLRGGFGNVYVGTWESPWTQTFRMWDVGTIGGWGPTTVIIGRGQSTGMSPSTSCTNADASSTGTGTASVTALAPTTITGGAGKAICGNASTSGGGIGHALWRRYSYAVFYESPIWSGVQAKLAIQPNENKTNFVNSGVTLSNGAGSVVGVNANPYSWSYSLSWTGMGGRARAYWAQLFDHDWTSIGQTDNGWTIGGGYDFGPVNLGATYETMKYKVGGNSLATGVAQTAAVAAAGDVTAAEWAIGVAIPVGPGHIGVSYAKANALSYAGTAPLLNDTGAKQWNLGYEWTLSKRTALGFGVARISNGAQATFAYTQQITSQNGALTGPGGGLGGNWPAGVSQTNLFVSMRHSF